MSRHPIRKFFRFITRCAWWQPNRSSRKMLRKEADAETKYVEDFCKKHEIEYYFKILKIFINNIDLNNLIIIKYKI